MNDGEAITQSSSSLSTFGFWVYIMTDCVVFASLFATFAVLRNSTYGGPGGPELFSLPFVLSETLILLTSSFTCGLAMLAAQRANKQLALTALALTFVLGLSFVGLELKEFHHLATEGNSWRRSAFLSSFFTLVGTHGFHVSIGLLWMAVLGLKIKTQGLLTTNLRKLTMLSLFWHFLDVIWIFIFSIVYMLGVIQ